MKLPGSLYSNTVNQYNYWIILHLHGPYLDQFGLYWRESTPQERFSVERSLDYRDTYLVCELIMIMIPGLLRTFGTTSLGAEGRRESYNIYVNFTLYTDVNTRVLQYLFNDRNDTESHTMKWWATSVTFGSYDTIFELNMPGTLYWGDERSSSWTSFLLISSSESTRGLEITHHCRGREYIVLAEDGYTGLADGSTGRHGYEEYR